LATLINDSTTNLKKVSEKVNPYHCDLCGIELFELQGHDFWLGVCFNPTHEKPRFGSFPWCNPHHYETRDLSEHESDLILKRKDDLAKRLQVVYTNWELISIVHCFSNGGFLPEVDERITKVKGKYL
jgi:hypothetical protein